jgi:hypothetical protein
MMKASVYNSTATATEVKTAVPLYEGSAIGTINDLETTNPTIIVIPDGQAPGADPAAQPGVRQGHSFFGCMCDMRRAVIIVNIISLFFVTIGVFTFSVLSSSKFQDEFDDNDDSQKGFDELDRWRGALIAIIVLSFIIHISGIVGGVRSSRRMVLVPGVWLSLGCLVNLLTLNIGAAVVCCLFAYPHFIFFREIQMGIMSTENYANERQSCCCV